MYFSLLSFFLFFLCGITLTLFYFIFFIFLKKVVQSTFKMEEMYHFVSQQLDDERKRRSAAVQTLAIAEDSNADLRLKLKAKEQARKSSDLVLKGAETQAESQRKLANEVKGQLVAAKEQMAALKQQLEEANKLKDLVEKAKL